MADHVERKAINALVKLDYERQARQQLRSGDLLFASGDHLVSKAIRKVTNSPWSHVGIVFRLAAVDRVLLLESVEDMGVRFAPLSKYVHDYERGQPYKGRIVIGRCRGVTADTMTRLSAFGIDELTQPYDKDEIARILARITLGMGRKARDREYICSELVYECFASAGIEFADNGRGFISPEDIWLDQRVAPVARIL